MHQEIPDSNPLFRDNPVEPRPWRDRKPSRRQSTIPASTPSMGCTVLVHAAIVQTLIQPPTIVLRVLAMSRQTIPQLPETSHEVNITVCTEHPHAVVVPGSVLPRAKGSATWRRLATGGPDFSSHTIRCRTLASTESRTDLVSASGVASPCPSTPDPELPRPQDAAGRGSTPATAR